jgi:hypothetical protein
MVFKNARILPQHYAASQSKQLAAYHEVQKMKSSVKYLIKGEFSTHELLT